MPQTHPYQVYKKTNVQTSDQAQLILMLYDGALRFMKKGKERIHEADMEGAHNYILRGRKIVSELAATLRPEKSGELGQNLKNLYAYSYKKLVEANFKKDPVLLDEVINIFTVLREGWVSLKAKQGTLTDRENRINMKM